MPKYNSFKLLPTDTAYVEKLRSEDPQQHAVLEAYELSVPAVSYKVIADSLGINLGTVKSRLNRARGKITKWRETERAEHDASRGTTNQTDQGAAVGPADGKPEGMGQG